MDSSELFDVFVDKGFTSSVGEAGWRRFRVCEKSLIKQRVSEQRIHEKKQQQQHR